jgi:hypothetical protein
MRCAGDSGTGSFSIRCPCTGKSAADEAVKHVRE